VILAAVIGASANADAFFIAFKIPNFLRRLFAEGAFSQAFVPVLAECRESRRQAAVRDLVDRIAGVLVACCCLTALTLAAAPLVAGLFAPGFIGQPEKFALTADLIRITFPYLMLISLTGMCGAILNSYGRFAVPAFTPGAAELVLIGAALLAAPPLPSRCSPWPGAYLPRAYSAAVPAAISCTASTSCRGRAGTRRIRACARS
jgi:putative peptidoglycan lipid II flippase